MSSNVFDPSEVVPEFTADVGIKKGKKVDYRSFNATPAKIGILLRCHE